MTKSYSAIRQDAVTMRSLDILNDFLDFTARPDLDGAYTHTLADVPVFQSNASSHSRVLRTKERHVDPSHLHPDPSADWDIHEIERRSLERDLQTIRRVHPDDPSLATASAEAITRLAGIKIGDTSLDEWPY